MLKTLESSSEDMGEPSQAGQARPTDQVNTKNEEVICADHKLAETNRQQSISEQKYDNNDQAQATSLIEPSPAETQADSAMPFKKRFAKAV